jgi:predicted RNA-binding protein Jag
MEHFQTRVKTLFELTGLHEPEVTFNTETKRIEVFINEGDWLKQLLPTLVNDFDYLIKLLAKKHAAELYFVDINNYRKDRENLIAELAKAAAKKASLRNEEIKLPAMNAYERRLIHVELAVHPSVRTESIGEGRERCVVVKPIQ